MTGEAPPAERPARRPAIAWRIIDGEAVMVAPASGKVHTLNLTGTRFWELLDGRRTVADIAALIAEEFDAPVERIGEDCRTFARELAERGLLEPGRVS